MKSTDISLDRQASSASVIRFEKMFIYIYIYVCVCVCLCVNVCLWHVSMRIFNLCMIPVRKIRLRACVTHINNQLAWQCIHPPPLDVAGRLVDNAFYVKLTEDHVRISLKRTFDGQMVIFFIIENIQIHHCICFLLILPFYIGFALSGIYIFFF